MKLREKQMAIELRKRGMSITRIAKELSVSKSTVSSWIQSVVVTNDIAILIAKHKTVGQLASQEAHRRITREKLEKAKTEAQKYFQK